MISLEQLNNALIGFQQRYFKEKAESDEKIKELGSVASDAHVRATSAQSIAVENSKRIKTLEDAREEQIKLNLELIEFKDSIQLGKPPKPSWKFWQR